MTCENSSSAVSPKKGGHPTKNSYSIIPMDHQSTGLPEKYTNKDEKSENDKYTQIKYEIRRQLQQFAVETRNNKILMYEKSHK